jgi:predicted DNA-binding ribbon-helix-helix protein
MPCAICAANKKSSEPLKKRSVKIAGHATSITLEDPFWDQLVAISKDEAISINNLIQRIDDTRGTANLSSAIRVYILETLKQQISSQNNQG